MISLKIPNSRIARKFHVKLIFFPFKKSDKKSALFFERAGRSATPFSYKERSGSGTPFFDKERERSGTLKKWERLTHCILLYTKSVLCATV